jgi:hypothetical protein
MKRKTQVLLLGGIVLVLLAVLLAPFFSGLTLLPADTVKSLPFSEFGRAQIFRHGHVAQWIPYLFGGMPCYASVMVTPAYLVSAIATWGLGSVLPVMKDPIVLHFLHLLLLGAGSFLYLRRRRLGWLAAGFGALTLTFSTTLVGLMGAGHTIKLWTVCWMPLALYWLDRLLEERSRRNLAPAALVLGMLFTVKHVQMSWYFLLFAGLYTLLRLWQMRGGEGRPWLGAGLRALAWVALALGLAAFFLLPVLDYSSLSMRAGTEAAVAGGAYAGSYSFPPADLLTWWIPGARGFGGGTYWGALEYTAFPLYAGALWLPLLVVAFLAKEDRRRLWPWLVPVLLMLLLGLGRFTPLFGALVDWLPGYAKLRAHMWALAPAQMGLVFIAALGLDRLLSLAAGLRGGAGPEAKTRAFTAPPTRWALGAALGALLMAGLFHLAKPDPQKGLSPGDSYRHELDEQRVAYYLQQQGVQPRTERVEQVVGQLRATRAAELRGDAARTLLFAGLASLALWLLLAGVLPLPALAVLLGLLVAADLLPMGRRTLAFEARRDPQALFRARGALAQLAALPDKHSFRVWPDGVYGTNEAVWHGLHSIEGYHGAKPAGIQRVLGEGRVALPGGGSTLHPAWLDLLNVQWVISRQSPPPWLEVAGQHPDGFLLRNPGALPRLSFPATWEALPGEEHFERVMAGLDPRALALVDPAPPLPAGLSTGEGRIVRYEPDRIELRLTTAGPTLALLSEIWLPRGWRATLDGREVPILRADHLLRAVAVSEAGDHHLILEYRPAAWIWGRWITLLTLAALLLGRFGLHRHHPAPAREETAAA